MSSNRPSVPTALKRKLYVESGHRCAIPTCKQTPVELAHITPWSECQHHSFENMIALCPTCHTRFDNGEMDRKSMLAYKNNLGTLNSRYGDFEKRIIHVFANDPSATEIKLPGGLEIMLMYLIQDGLLQNLGIGTGTYVNGMPTEGNYRLTQKGRAFINHWLGGREIE